MARILNTKDVVFKLGVSRSTFYAMLKDDPRFPKPVRLTQQRVGYLESEIDDYIQALAADRDQVAA